MKDIAGEKQRAYERLAEIVKRLREQDRKTRSAGLKTFLNASYLAEGGFDEHRLGFLSFRAFILAAAESGYVLVRPAPVGPDVDVLPPDSSTPLENEASQSNRIRNDLWTAFIDWRTEWARVYDRETERVGWLGVHGWRGEGEAMESLRRAMVADPSRYVAIAPVGQEQMLRWMHEFAESIGEVSSRAAVGTALSSSAPIRAFVLATRESGLHDGWNRMRLEKVRGHIQAWAAEHKLTLDLITEREPLSTPHAYGPPSARSRSQQLPAPPPDELRDRVCAAVRKMSRGELLRLAIPLEYILGDDQA